MKTVISVVIVIMAVIVINKFKKSISQKLVDKNIHPTIKK